MAKLESSFKNMTLSLTIICMVAAAALGGVYILTQQTIEDQKVAKQEAARAAVLAGCEDGQAIEAEVDGFGGKVRIMFGFAPDGTILGYEVLEQQETPGLGTHMVEWFKNADKPGQCVVGRKATGAMQVSKDGGDVDAITAATISSRAFLAALNQAYGELAKVEACSGATKQCAGEHACCGHCEHAEGEHACAGECGHAEGEEHHCCGKCAHHENVESEVKED